VRHIFIAVSGLEVEPNGISNRRQAVGLEGI